MQCAFKAPIKGADKPWILCESVCVRLRLLYVCVHLIGSCQRGAKQKPRKGQTGVGSRFSLGHRWRGRAECVAESWGHEEEGVSGMSAPTCVCMWVSEVGGELFVNAWKMPVCPLGERKV